MGEEREKEKELKISFQSKEAFTCPVCGTTFHREELLSGSGRLIAGGITDELHRLYEPSSRYGEVYPLVYQPTVCPFCWFAAMDKDFQSFPRDRLDKALADEEGRLKGTELIFAGVNFNDQRGLLEGAAAYYLVVRCYDYFSREFSPTMKQGLASLRGAWLLEHLDVRKPGEHYDWLALRFKQKAQYFYSQALAREVEGIETLSAVTNFGPDTDKNYGFEGALYLKGLLEMKYGPREDSAARVASLSETKRNIAKIFGLGKSSKARPGPLLERAKALYEDINKELHETDE